MPRYTVEEDGWGQFPPFYPAAVFDAEGNEIRNVVRCDADTGRCEVQEMDDAGRPLVACGAVVTVWKTFPAPLRLEPTR